MKKVFTLFLSLLFVSVSWAQDSMETALELGESNSWTYDESVEGSYIYFKYTATDAVVIKPSSTSMSVVESVDGTETSLKSMQLANYTYGYIARAGHTVYVKASKSSSGVSFTAEFLSYTGLGDGETEDDPMEIVAGETQVIGPAINTSYSTVSSYATYTATADGVLVLTAYGSASVTANGTSYSFAYSNGSYVCEIPVTSGETYSLVFSGQSAICFTSELTNPEPGELSNPFTIVVGENEVPAAYGTYYYTYTATAAGYAKISSSETIPSGHVYVFNTKTNVSYGSYATYAKAADGAFDVRFEVFAGTTYYIEVDKADATDAEQTFTFSYSDYAAGDKESDPIAISSSSEQTLPNASGTFYYSYTVPANTHKFLVVSATSTILNSSTQVSIYPQGSSSYYGVSGAAPQQTEVNVTSATTYIIKWVSYETSDVKFTVELQEIEDGDVITKPITAVKGSNAVASGTKYYTYTPETSCKLTLEGTAEITMTFPKGTGTYDGTYTATQSGATYTLNVDAGTVYYIKTVNTGDASSFYLSEVAYAEGDSRSVPIDVSDTGSYTLTTANSGGVWLSYTAASDGILTIACDATYLNTATVYYYVNDATYGSSMISTDYTTYTNSYKVETSVSAGDVYYVYVSGLSAGSNVTFTLTEPGEGESIATAIELVKDEAKTITAATSTKPMWYKANLSTGTVNITFNGSARAYLYTSEDNARSGTYESVSFSGSYDSSTSTYTYSASYNVTTPGYHYIQVYYASNVNIVLSGAVSETTGISAINADVTTGAVYNLSGVKVGSTTAGLPSGVYVVKANGKTRKVIVK